MTLMYFIVLLSVVITLSYLFDMFLIISLHKYSHLERQISACEWEKYESSIGTKNNLKKGEVSRVVKKSDLVTDL